MESDCVQLSLTSLTSLLMESGAVDDFGKSTEGIPRCHTDLHALLDVVNI